MTWGLGTQRPLVWNIDRQAGRWVGGFVLETGQGCVFRQPVAGQGSRARTFPRGREENMDSSPFSSDLLNSAARTEHVMLSSMQPKGTHGWCLTLLGSFGHPSLIN